MWANFFHVWMWDQVIIKLLFTKSVNATENHVCLVSFKSLDLSLCIAKQSVLQKDSTRWRAGCVGLIRISDGKFSEAGSSINCVRCIWFGCCRRPLLGMWSDKIFSRFGRILALVSAVALHLAIRCTMSSVWAGLSGNGDRQADMRDLAWGLYMYTGCKDSPLLAS